MAWRAKLRKFVEESMMPVISSGVRFDTVSYSDFAANFTDFRQLVRARSRLYRSRFLQPNTHFAAFFEIYKNIIPSHRSEFKILANFRWKVFAIFKISSEILIFFRIFIGFCTDFDENFSELRQIPYRMSRIRQISGFLTNSDRMRA